MLAFNRNTQETEAGGFLWVQSQPGARIKFQVSQGYYTETKSNQNQNIKQKQIHLIWLWQKKTRVNGFLSKNSGRFWRINKKDYIPKK